MHVVLFAKRGILFYEFYLEEMYELSPQHGGRAFLSACFSFEITEGISMK
jgi:hypothetical protein